MPMFSPLVGAPLVSSASLTGKPPSITSASTASGTVGYAFSYQITADNSPTSYNATSLPAGLSINTSTGLISGTPTASGTFNVTLSAINAFGTGTTALTLTISATLTAPAIISSLSATGALSSAFSYQISATNGPTSYNATSLPAGLSINTSIGLISGTPTVSGSFFVTISATNSAGTGSAVLTLTIVATSSGIKRILLGAFPEGGGKFGLRVSQPLYDASSNPVNNERLVFNSDWPAVLPIHVASTLTLAAGETKTINFPALGYIPHASAFIKEGSRDWQNFITSNTLLCRTFNGVSNVILINPVNEFAYDGNFYTKVQFKIYSSSFTIYTSTATQVSYSIYRIKAFT